MGEKDLSLRITVCHYLASLVMQIFQSPPYTHDQAIMAVLVLLNVTPIKAVLVLLNVTTIKAVLVLLNFTTIKAVLVLLNVTTINAVLVLLNVTNSSTGPIKCHI